MVLLTKIVVAAVAVAIPIQPILQLLLHLLGEHHQYPLLLHQPLKAKTFFIYKGIVMICCFYSTIIIPNAKVLYRHYRLTVSHLSLVLFVTYLFHPVDSLTV
jgi:hypothetical protein